ncbi:MAG: F0F1 ATP synthase subunit A [Patescibacteria group bacterium]|nr:F0F1 ATP synthase subunit A [Patescibacteria group bacterium]
MDTGIHVILAAEQVGTLWGIPITNSLIMTWVVMALIVAFALVFSRRIALVPGKLQTTLEWAVEGGINYIRDTLEDEKMAVRFFPLIASLAIFIMIGNELEFFPGIGSIGFVHGADFIPLFRTPATDLNTTLALTLISVITIEVAGVMSVGFFKYAGKFLNFHSPVKFIVGLIELISELARLITFSFRLFGNIFAGEVLVAIVGFFVPYVLPAPFIMFELFVGVVQAVIFALLTLFFLKLAVTPMEEH